MNPFRLPHALIIIVLVTARISPAQEAETRALPPSGIFWIDWAADQMAFALEEAAPADPKSDATATMPAQALPATHSIESVATDRLREEVRLMRDLIEQGVIGRIIALENEVRTLRGALQQQQIAAYGNGNIVPQPGLPLGMAPNGPVPAAPPGAPPAPAILPDAPMELPPDPFEFTVVNEWGRSPETVAELGGSASTLIGVTGVVPPRSAREDVTALAQQLRAEYADYDNINIEIFDTDAAAQEYVDTQSVDPAHHIATISRHKATGRDLIVYLGQGQPEIVPLPAE